MISWFHNRQFLQVLGYIFVWYISKHQKKNIFDK
jgi:hypothetical protein